MKLDNIHKTISAFKVLLKREVLSEMDWLYYKQFDLSTHDHLNSSTIYDWLIVLFESDRTKRLWKNEQNRAAELMLKLVDYDPSMVAIAFAELFHEERDLEGRIDRFKFYSEELLRALRKKEQSIRESWHHQDNSIISYYLSMKFPQKYSYYNQILHQTLIDVLGAKPLGDIEDLVRYQKMVNTFSNFIFKDEELLTLHRKRFNKPIIETSRLIVYEIAQACRNKILLA